MDGIVVIGDFVVEGILNVLGHIMFITIEYIKNIGISEFENT